jgi:TonB family protein
MTLRDLKMRRAFLALLALALMPGCATYTDQSEHAVDNPMPSLRPGEYTVKTVDVPPVATSQREPDFPNGLSYVMSGMAFVSFTVRSDGRVADASIVRADDVQFGEAAVSAILKWRFRPAQVKGTAVDCRMTMPFYFANTFGYRLDEADSAPVPSSPPGSNSGSIQVH